MSAQCSLGVELVNQDPYPALPGEYVKVVFQFSGADHPNCGTTQFWIEEKYPFSLESGQKNIYTFNAGGSSADSSLRNFNQYILIPYRLRIDSNAFDGDNEVTVHYSSTGAGSPQSNLKDFNITLEDTLTDFEVYVKDYDFKTKEIVFEILNTGKEDVEALTIEIPEQEGVTLIGSNRVIIGSLDSNEEDSVRLSGDFDVSSIRLEIFYTDLINERRFLEKTIPLNLEPFSRKPKQDSGFSPFWTFIIGLAIPLIYIYWKKFRDKKKPKHEMHHLHKSHKR